MIGISMLRVIMIEKFLRMNLPMSRVTTDCVANAIRGELVPKVVSCLQTVTNTISSTSVSRGVFYGPGHQHTRDEVLIQW